MDAEQKAALVKALDALPPSRSFAAGYGFSADGDEEDMTRLPGVLIRWPDTKEGRDAASVFAQIIWAKPSE